ncbi:MAG: peptidylprolyl isomerase [Tannerellaceae bacterium]|jgi:peptidylprolyl isomerase/peptidyl-prolyl cis-trans isomerase B (cyclophilin B)|nr:peptidylprolyl isomerase [Tannerellaceae bacterium]
MKRVLFTIIYSSTLSLLSLTAQTKETVVLIETDLGKIKVKLYNETPQHRDNFIKNVSAKLYDGILFHRVIKHFMIQAGDVNSKTATADTPLGNGDLGYTIPAEFIYPKYFHKRGALCAARTGDHVNPEKASSASQFYIVTGKYYTDMELDKMERVTGMAFTSEQRQAYMKDGGAPHLDGAYTVFGEVIDGMKIVDEIQSSPTGNQDRPLKDICIKSAAIVKK